MGFFGKVGSGKTKVIAYSTKKGIKVGMPNLTKKTKKK